MRRTEIAAAYDAIASDYDLAVAGDTWMRRQVWESYRRSFRAGQNILDLSCGTGIDAVYLASRGVNVTGIDVSPAMIEQFDLNARKAGVEARVTATVLDISDLASLPDQAFDGAISAFAGLNTVEDLASVADQLARILRPRAPVVFHLLNRFSLWEWLGLVFRGRWTDARELGSTGRRAFQIGGRAVEHVLYEPSGAYRYSFAKHFRLRRSFGLGIFRPPHTVGRVPSFVVRGLEYLDRFAGGTEPFVRWGRFFVLELEHRT
jgi:SAM-dependent methyltransferase